MKGYCYGELRAVDREDERKRVHSSGKIALGDYVRTDLNEFGTVVGFLTIPGLVVLEDWTGCRFHAVEEYCRLVSRGGK